MSEPTDRTAALETPGAVRELEGAVRRDLSKIRALYVGGGELLSVLEDAVRVLPDSRGTLRNWRLQTEELARQMEEEADVIAKKLTGDGSPVISESVDAARVVQLRREA